MKDNFVRNLIEQDFSPDKIADLIVKSSNRIANTYKEKLDKIKEAIAEAYESLTGNLNTFVSAEDPSSLDAALSDLSKIKSEFGNLEQLIQELKKSTSSTAGVGGGIVPSEPEGSETFQELAHTDEEK